MGPFQQQMSWSRHVPATWPPFFGLSCPLPPPLPFCLLSLVSRLDKERERKTAEKEGSSRVEPRYELLYCVAPLPFFLPFSLLPLSFSSSRRDAPAALVVQRISHRCNGESVASRLIVFLREPFYRSEDAVFRRLFQRILIRKSRRIKIRINTNIRKNKIDKNKICNTDRLDDITFSKSYFTVAQSLRFSGNNYL